MVLVLHDVGGGIGETTIDKDEVVAVMVESRRTATPAALPFEFLRLGLTATHEARARNPPTIRTPRRFPGRKSISMTITRSSASRDSRPGDFGQVRDWRRDAAHDRRIACATRLLVVIKPDCARFKRELF